MYYKIIYKIHFLNSICLHIHTYILYIVYCILYIVYCILYIVYFTNRHTLCNVFVYFIIIITIDINQTWFPPRSPPQNFPLIFSHFHDVSHLEAGVVACPAAVVAAVKEAVREQRQVSTGHTLPADLSQLALLTKEKRILRLLTNER